MTAPSSIETGPGLASVLFQDSIITNLRCIIGPQMPNLFFYGSTGIGKTFTARAIAHELYKTPKGNYFEYQLTHERGIQYIREKIKFVSGIATGQFKLVVLDGIDMLTIEAQAALRRILEAYNSTTRFCLISSTLTNISPALLSRCLTFNFKRPSGEDLTRWCAERYPSIDYSHLIKLSQGDFRWLKNQIAVAELSDLSIYKSEGIPEETGCPLNYYLITQIEKTPEYSKYYDVIAGRLYGMSEGNAVIQLKTSEPAPAYKIHKAK
ncbi:MAG: AAA family ATPase [Actinobacteria bacterium]|uniref:Unannotated protein n=1 Tax=freshwater metagenome TaxID=449393 RepID=A0A6J6EVF4_9ZZZZ|nr:AAA family ATPase [Actinomycetota bacterium]